MPTYQIKDVELCKTVTCEAPGLAELMLDYLPWPTLEVEIHWQPSVGKAVVIDKYTQFKYEVQII